MAVPLAAAAVAAVLPPSPSEQLAAAGPLWGFQGRLQFPRARAGEAQMLADAAGIARDNLLWTDVEKVRGVYDFTAYAALLAELEAAVPPVRAMWTLSFGNPLYDGGLPPHSAEGRSAFAKYAVAAVRRFAGHGIYWELWNEPNGGGFWPSPNASDFAELANVVGEAVEAAGLGMGKETFIGPNTAMWWEYDVDMDFLETCLAAGNLRWWGAVNVHLYRATAPETALDTLRKVRALVARHTPAGRGEVPILSGEWGYSVCDAPCDYPYTGACDEAQQARYLARQWLVLASAGVPVAVWYGFYDDVDDPHSMGGRLGVARRPYLNATVPHEPRPAYAAARTLQRLFRGAPFVRRADAELAKLPSHRRPHRPYAPYRRPAGPVRAGMADGVSVMGYSQGERPNDALYALGFGAGGVATRWAVWSVAGAATVAFDVGAAECFQRVALDGGAGGAQLCADAKGRLVVPIATDTPQYLLRTAACGGK